MAQSPHQAVFLWRLLIAVPVLYVTVFPELQIHNNSIKFKQNTNTAVLLCLFPIHLAAPCLVSSVGNHTAKPSLLFKNKQKKKSIVTAQDKLIVYEFRLAFASVNNLLWILLTCP